MKPLRKILLGFIVLMATTLPVLAQEGKAPGLSVRLVTPPDTPAQSYFSYKVPAGGTQEGAIDLENNGKATLEIEIYPADAYTTQDGALSGPLLGEASKKTGTWLAVDATKVTLTPGQTKRVKFKMAVPAGVSAGDYFSFIFIQPTEIAPGGKQPEAPPDDKRPVSIAVKVVQRLGICIWERVPGNLQNGMKVGAVKKIIDHGRLFLELPLANTGNTYLKPKGSWALKSPGGEVLTSQEENEFGYILPGESMKIRIPVQTNRPLVRGDYSLQYTIRFADQTTSDQASITLP